MLKTKSKAPKSNKNPFRLSKTFYKQLATYIARDKSFRERIKDLLKRQKSQISTIWALMADLDEKDRKTIIAAAEYIALCDKIVSIVEEDLHKHPQENV